MTTAPMPAPSARHLLDTDQCAAGCLLAVSHPRTCSCRCAGRHHGALLDSAVSVEPERTAA